jgi:drug/metabolite transporter (DMT)-like permease
VTLAFGPLARRPVLAAVLGALTIATSAILVRLADTTPATAAIFRCAYALPPLLLLAWYERRRYGPRAPGQARLAWIAGAFFAADLVMWHHAIGLVGAGLATVLGNTQVVMVPIIAWLVLGERQANADQRRPAGPLFTATLSAAIFSILIGLPLGEVDLVPSWPTHGWLLVLALGVQVIGWLFISLSLSRLPAAVTSVVLTIQPVGSVLLGMWLLHEAPSEFQLLGVLFILAGLAITTLRLRAPWQRTAPQPGVG